MSRRIGLAFVVLYFAVGGLAHFAFTEAFVSIVPPSLPFRTSAVYLSGVLELVGALALLHPRLRRSGGVGLILLTVCVTPANVYMWQHADAFPMIPRSLLAARLAAQVPLIACIAWATHTGPLHDRRNMP